MSELLLGVLLILTVAWLVVRIRQNKAAEKADAQPRLRATGAFHAVAIQYSADACDAAKAMTGRRFLATGAPRLPLPECDHVECRCQFAHYEDRRAGRDRRSPFSPAGPIGNTGKHAAERRQRKDRRKDADKYDW